MILSKPSLAILVDCWSDRKDQIFHQTWSNIQNKIERENIQTIILATYDYDITSHWPSRWFINTHDIFLNGHPNPEEWIKCLPEAIGTAPGYTRQTDPQIMNLKTDALQLMLHHPIQLIWYLENLAPHIESVWYFGFAWNVCLASRPIGYNKIKSYFANRNIDVLTDSQCVVAIESKNVYRRPNSQNLIGWENIFDTTYKLIN